MAHRTTWVKLHGDVFANKKIVRAAAALTRGDVEKMVGHLARLWTWAADNAEDGDFGYLNPTAIAQAAGWPRSAKAFVQVLIEEKLLDSGPRVHDWDQYAGRLVERRKADRERKQRDRARPQDSPPDGRVESPQDIPRDVRYPREETEGEERAGSREDVRLEDPHDQRTSEDLRSRLDRAFRRLGCTDEALKQRLAEDDGLGAIVPIVERLAEHPAGRPGSSPSSRITKYLAAAEDTIEEERRRVREERFDRLPREEQRSIVREKWRSDGPSALTEHERGMLPVDEQLDVLAALAGGKTRPSAM